MTPISSQVSGNCVLQANDDVQNRLLAMLQHLPHAAQRKAYVNIVSKIDTDARLGASLSSLELAKLCLTDEDAHHVHALVENVSTESIPGYLPDLYTLLRRIPSNQWQMVRDIVIGENHLEIIQIAKQFLLTEEQQPAEQVLSLLEILANYIDQEDLPTMSVLIAFCQDGNFIPAIIQSLYNVDDDIRGDALALVTGSLNEPVSSNNILLRLMVILGQLDVQTPAEFVVSRDDFSDNPVEVLANLIEFLDQGNRSPLSIGFIDSDTRGPGVAKEFFSELLIGVSTKLGFEKLSDGRFRLNKLNANHVYHNIGKLLGYCLEQQLVIGALFDPGLFIGVMNLDEVVLHYDFCKENIPLYFPLYKKMKSYYEDDISAIAQMEKTLSDPDTLDVLEEDMAYLIMPCMAIKLGLILPEAIQTADDLEIAIQGKTTASQLLNQISWGTGITDSNRPQIEAWIRNLDNDRAKLLKLLSVVTGAPGLGQDPIRIEVSGISIQAHTCVQQLSLPSDITIEEALVELDKALNQKGYFNEI